MIAKNMLVDHAYKYRENTHRTPPTSCGEARSSFVCWGRFPDPNRTRFLLLDPLHEGPQTTVSLLTKIYIDQLKEREREMIINHAYLSDISFKSGELVHCYSHLAHVVSHIRRADQ